MKKDSKLVDHAGELDSFINNLKLYIPSTIIILALIYFVPRWITLTPPSLDASVWGAAGDFFGGFLNPCLSILTILLLVRSLRLQNKELADATEQLSLTREVHSQSLLYDDIKETFQKRVKDILAHQNFNILEKKVHNSLFSTEALTFSSKSSDILNILAFDYQKIKDNIEYSEEEYRSIIKRVDYEFFVINQEIKELCEATQDLLKMGIPAYLIRDDLQKVHGLISKLYAINKQMKNGRLEESWKLYKQITESPDVTILL